ncbi:hypothetical protein BDW22DRAFT_1361813 [Trametopsis cervina]|nr:hypothetical protein BDW22DRAFT_1361813 [Trametopsis cervina]
MSNAARETLPTPEAKLDFALKILSFLLDEDASQLSMMHDMSKLTSRSCTILADLIADGLRPQLQRFRSSHEFDWDHNPWSWDSLMLLLAKLPCLLSKEASATVALCFSTTDPYLNGVFQRIFPLAVTTGEDLHGRNEVIHEHNKDERSTNALHLLERLDQVLYQIDITYVLGALQALFHSAFCTCSTCKDLRECWETHTADIPHLAIDHACDILAKCVLRDVQAGVSWNGWHDDIMLILCVRSRELPDNAPIAWHSNFKDLVHFILLSRALTPCFSLILYDRVRQEVDYMNVFHSIFIKSAQKVAILRNLHDAFRNYVEEIQKEPHLNDIYFRNSVLRFLRRQIDLMQDTITHGVPQDAVAMHYMTTWRSILNTIHRALQGFDALQVESEADITIRAENILAEIDTLDAAWSIMCGEGLRADPDPDTDFENWATQFDPRDEFVSDEVVIDLLRLLPSTKQSVKSRRARRIDYLRNHPSLLSALSPESRNSGHPEYNWCGAAQPAESQENSSSPEEVLVQVPEDTRPSTTQLNGPDQTEQPAQPPNITDFWGPAYSNTGGTAVEEMHGRTAKGRENSDSGPASVVQSSAGSVDLLPPTRIPDSTPIPPLLSEVHDPGKAREPVDIERLSIPHSSDYPEKGTLTG